MQLSGLHSTLEGAAAGYASPSLAQQCESHMPRCPDDLLPLARYLNNGTKKQPTKAFESSGEVWKGGDTWRHCGICVRHGSSLPDGTRTNNCVFGE